MKLLILFLLIRLGIMKNTHMHTLGEKLMSSLGKNALGSSLNETQMNFKLVNSKERYKVK